MGVALLCALVVGLGVGVGIMRSHADRQADERTRASAERTANEATASMLSLIRRERATADSARAHARVADSTVGAAKDFRGRFTPSDTPSAVTYTSPGVPPVTFVLPAPVLARFAKDSAALEEQIKQTGIEYRARILAEQALDTARVVIAAKETIIAVEKRQAKRAFWHGVRVGAIAAVAVGVVVRVLPALIPKL